MQRLDAGTTEVAPTETQLENVVENRGGDDDGGQVTEVVVDERRVRPGHGAIHEPGSEHGVLFERHQRRLDRARQAPPHAVDLFSRRQQQDQRWPQPAVRIGRGHARPQDAVAAPDGIVLQFDLEPGPFPGVGHQLLRRPVAVCVLGFDLAPGPFPLFLPVLLSRFHHEPRLAEIRGLAHEIEGAADHLGDGTDGIAHRSPPLAGHLVR
ncbi:MULTISPECIES: hypothetical protein [unclassified Amycolatopsis]|uniref:hypothetical protein n=1 Tax=unclassified Amycolatopsis TaxID=2618356 RepID=UPI0037BEB9EB